MQILTDITNIILKTADPITPLTPISSFAKKTPITTVANSGAEDPAAIKVAPATSGDNFNSGKWIKKMILKNIFRLMGKGSLTYPHIFYLMRTRSNHRKR